MRFYYVTFIEVGHLKKANLAFAAVFKLNKIETTLLSGVGMNRNLCCVGCSLAEVFCHVNWQDALRRSQALYLIKCRAILHQVVWVHTCRSFNHLEVVGIAARLWIAVDHRSHPLKHRRLCRNRIHQCTIACVHAAVSERINPHWCRSIVAHLEGALAQRRVINDLRRRSQGVPAIDVQREFIRSLGKQAK